MTPSLDDFTSMQLAIDASRAALEAGNSPYGAALVSAGGRVLHVAGNTQKTSGDATNHAEMVLLREAESRLGQMALRGSTVYASGEPCAMCSGALYWAGVRRVVYAASNDVMAELMGADTVLPIRCADVLANASPAVQVDGPVLAEPAAQVLREAAAQRAGGSVPN